MEVQNPQTEETTPAKKGSLSISDDTLKAAKEKISRLKKESKKGKQNGGKKGSSNGTIGKKKVTRRPIVYIGHLPHGFYEEELRGFFSQFGQVCRVKVSRSKKTGQSKGYAFVEFSDDDVARIAAETMNNYLMFERLLKTKYIPAQKVHQKMFPSRWITPESYPALERRKMMLKKQEEKPTSEEVKKHRMKVLKSITRSLAVLQDLGIDDYLPLVYDPPQDAAKEVQEETKAETCVEKTAETESQDQAKTEMMPTSTENVSNDKPVIGTPAAKKLSKVRNNTPKVIAAEDKSTPIRTSPTKRTAEGKECASPSKVAAEVAPEKTAEKVESKDQAKAEAMPTSTDKPATGTPAAKKSPKVRNITPKAIVAAAEGKATPAKTLPRKRPAEEKESTSQAQVAAEVAPEKAAETQSKGQAKAEVMPTLTDNVKNVKPAPETPVAKKSTKVSAKTPAKLPESEISEAIKTATPKGSKPTPVKAKPSKTPVKAPIEASTESPKATAEEAPKVEQIKTPARTPQKSPARETPKAVRKETPKAATAEGKVTPAKTSPRKRPAEGEENASPAKVAAVRTPVSIRFEISKSPAGRIVVTPLSAEEADVVLTPKSPAITPPTRRLTRAAAKRMSLKISPKMDVVFSPRLTRKVAGTPSTPAGRRKSVKP